MAQKTVLQSRLIIVDPSMKDDRDRHYALTRVIADNAIKNGFGVVIFSSKSVNSGLKMCGLKVRPVFSRSLSDYFTYTDSKPTIKDRLRSTALGLPRPVKFLLKKLRNKLHVYCFKAGLLIPSNNSGIADELLNALAQEGVCGRDHVLIHTADAIMYRAILQIIQCAYSPGSHPYYHLCTPYDIKEMPYTSKGLSVNRAINYMRLMGAINCLVFLYAENKSLASFLTDEWGANVSVLDFSKISSDKYGEVVVPFLLETNINKLLAMVRTRGKLVSQGDVRSESRYNVQLREADVSEDGHALYVKQV